MELSAAELASAEAQAKRLEAAVKTLRPIVASRLVDLYKLGRPGYWRMLLSVDDLQSVGRTFRTVSAIVQQDRARVDSTRTLAALADTKSTLAKRAEAAAGTRAEAQTARAALDRAVAAQSARMAEIDARRDLNAQLTGELQEAARRLQASVGGGSRPIGLCSRCCRSLRFAAICPGPRRALHDRRSDAAVPTASPPPSSGTAFSSASRRATGRAPCTKGASRSQVHSPASQPRHRRTWRGGFFLVRAFALACGCARRYGRAPGGTRRDGTHPSRRPRSLF